jgi:hypothetical protein
MAASLSQTFPLPYRSIERSLFNSRVRPQPQPEVREWENAFAVVYLAAVTVVIAYLVWRM